MTVACCCRQATLRGKAAHDIIPYWISYLQYGLRAQVDKAARWGDLESDEEEESEEEEEEEEAGDEGALADGLASVASGYSSLPSGIETPEVLDLRKAKAIGGGAQPSVCVRRIVC